MSALAAAQARYDNAAPSEWDDFDLDEVVAEMMLDPKHPAWECHDKYAEHQLRRNAYLNWLATVCE